MLKHLDLFSGIGGFSLGLERTGGFETVAFCEIDPFCQKVLKKHWPDVPIHEDVRSLEYDGPVDIITGGYPCQPFSAAGKRQGKEDDRHLWPAMFSIVKKHRPTWVIGENVAGHINMGLDDVLSDLGSVGYRCRTFIIPASAINAGHRRDRLWIVANSPSIGLQKDNNNGLLCEEAFNPWYSRLLTTSDNAIDFIQKKHLYDTRNMGESNGVSRGVDRIKGSGNAVVPQIPEIIGYAILESEQL